MKLDADHGSVCKFGSNQTDQDNFKLVRSNLSDLYKSAVKNSELNTTFDTVGQKETATDEDELKRRFAQLRKPT